MNTTTPPDDSLPHDSPVYKLLESFHLYHTARTWNDITKKAAQENLSYQDFLTRILSQEASIKHAKTVERLIREARFPTIKTIDSFDWNHPAKIDKQVVLNAVDVPFVQSKGNLIFVGPSGVGKTHLAIAVGYAACHKEIKTLYTTAADMINHLVAAHADHSLERALKRYSCPKLLVLDELGYLPLDKNGRDLFFQVISQRYETGSIILTTNRAFKDWPEIFQDHTATTAIIDRLAHHAELIKIEGSSYRAKKKKPGI